MAAIEVCVVVTKCHSAANFVRAVPNHLKKETLDECLNLNFFQHVLPVQDVWVVLPKELEPVLTILADSYYSRAVVTSGGSGPPAE